ncbi:MAG TPA: NADP-dependent oxidoreductase [Spirochaetia bacterium]|nr:NADP-dependent oxidoreductase [Spirochaetia bacterium]
MSEMKAVRYHEYGDSGKLSVESVPRPEPKAGEVLVHVRYSGVNPVDWKLRSGMYKAFMPVTFPSTPGREFSGLVEEVGQGVTNFSKGQKVFGTANGSYAEYVVTPAANVAPIPDGVTFEQAASIALGAITASGVLEDADVKPGQTVVVVGAAGGVGLFAVQLAKAKGAKVYGVASKGNQDFVRSLGAEPVDYSAGPVSAKVKDADVVIDTVGGDALESAFTLVKKGGLLLTVAGRPSEEKAKQLGITAKSSGSKGSGPLPGITEMLAAGKLITAPGKIFPLAQAGAAQDLSQAGHGRGRILLRV